ncbi:MAG TPA: hypothetical protein VH054_29555 [Polyangiaceae bacterium]|nr:hypothetical protein [Polyangiaceae bacterium]
MRSWLVIAASALAFGCATGSSADDSTSDSGSLKDGTVDAPKSDGGCPTGYTGASCSNCVGGFHECGTECTQDNANSPDAGCTLGCGNTPCATPQNASATCTTDGHCDFACHASFDKTDGGCDCPSGTILCASTCQQCCTDTDCTGHQTCSAGVCQGCQAGWGDCNNNTTDGCETHLDSTSNCGSCGHSCCGSFCGCGFLGVGGESCNANGTSFSCGC